MSVDPLLLARAQFGLNIGFHILFPSITIALAWVLAWPGVTGAIVGARNPKQVEGWIDAAGVQLSTQDLDEISAALRKTEAGRGPVTPEEISQERAS